MTEHSETVTVVPSEELYRSRSSLLKQQYTMCSALGFPKSPNLAPDVQSNLDRVVLDVKSV